MLVLEAGPYIDRDTTRPSRSRRSPALYRDGGLTVAEGRPAIPTPVGRAVGGTTVINSGTCFRTPEPVLERWVAEHGIDWATRARRRLRRGRGDAGRPAGRSRADGPQRPAAAGGRRRARRQPRPALAATPARCVQCSSCPIGCRLDAKRAMHVSYLPRAVAAGARIRAGVEAQRILFAAAGAPRGRVPSPGPAAQRQPTAYTVRARKARGPRRRRLRHARAPACARAFARPAASSGATCASTRRAGSARASRRRCAAGRA